MYLLPLLCQPTPLHMAAIDAEDFRPSPPFIIVFANPQPLNLEKRQLRVGSNYETCTKTL